MPNDLTPAEQAAAEVFARIGFKNAPAEVHARAVVDAVRSIIADETLEHAAAVLDRKADVKRHNVEHGYSTASFEYIEGIEHASALIERRRNEILRAARQFEAGTNEPRCDNERNANNPHECRCGVQWVEP